MAKDVRTGCPDTPLESGRTWAVARLAHFSQCFPSGQHIRIGYAIMRERGPYTCTCRRSPLRSITQSTRGGIPSADISHPEFRASTFYILISHSRMGEEAFQLPRIGMSGSSDSVHPESILGQHFRLPGFCRVSRCSPKASRYLPPTKLDFFSQDILCKFLFSPCNQSKILLGYFLENIFSIYIFEPM